MKPTFLALFFLSSSFPTNAEEVAPVPKEELPAPPAEAPVTPAVPREEPWDPASPDAPFDPSPPPEPLPDPPAMPEAPPEPPPAPPAPTISPDLIQSAFAGRQGAFVLTDCASKGTFLSDPVACEQKVAPCSTFKIWNTAIGLETGMVKDPDATFWKWDGQERSIADWNKDQTLRSAFWVSCVPAFQDLARQIGKDRMADWLGKIDYGDRNIESGVDVFWLPQPPDRATLLISPKQQAELIVKLVNGELPFSAQTQATLKNIMLVRKSEHATLYGKTGSGDGATKEEAIGWFVGWVENEAGKRHAFSCLLKGEGVSGKDARDAAEAVLAGLGCF